MGLINRYRFPMCKYSRQPAEPTKSAKCRVADLRTHYKNTYNVAHACKGLKLDKAIHYMNRCLEHTSIIPFRVYTGGVGRHAQTKEFKHTLGRWPRSLSLLFANSSRTSEPTLRARDLTSTDASSTTPSANVPSVDADVLTVLMVESPLTSPPTAISNSTSTRSPPELPRLTRKPLVSPRNRLPELDSPSENESSSLKENNEQRQGVAHGKATF